MPALTDLAKAFTKLSRDLEKGINAAELKTATKARRIAITQFSLGPYSLEQLADVGHPFGYGANGRQRGSSSIYPPAVINAGGTYDDGKPRGTFAKDWSEPALTSVAGTRKVSFENTDPNTVFLWGTNLMVDRSGMLEIVPALVQPQRERDIEAVIDRVGTTAFG